MENNIVLIINSLSGGIGRVSLGLAKIFIERNYSVVIIPIKDDIDYNINKNIKIISLNYAKKSHIPENIRILFYAYKLNKILNTIPNKKLIIGSLTLSTRFMNVINNAHKFYCTIHTNISKSKIGTRTGIRKFIRKKKLKKLYNNKHIICVSNGVKEDILSLGIKPKSIQTIYNPFDFSEIRNKAKEKINFLFPEEDYIVHVGHFDKVKRHDILLKAFSQIENKKIKLILVGQGKEEHNIKQLISELDLKERVIFAGLQKNPFPIIQNAKALVLSSEREGFGNVIVEALILNTPIVSTNCPSGPSEIMTGNLQKFLAKVDDPYDLANKINLVLSSDLTIDNKLIERFEINEIAKQYIKIIEEK